MNRLDSFLIVITMFAWPVSRPMKRAEAYYDKARAQERGVISKTQTPFLSIDQVLQSLYNFHGIRRSSARRSAACADPGFLGRKVRPTRSAALFRYEGAGSFRFGRMLSKLAQAAESFVSKSLWQQKTLVIQIEHDETTFSF